ncbi:hypothetical protein QOT17_002852 [Balamuthia mandrillaris]
MNSPDALSKEIMGSEESGDPGASSSPMISNKRTHKQGSAEGRLRFRDVVDIQLDYGIEGSSPSTTITRVLLPSDRDLEEGRKRRFFRNLTFFKRVAEEQLRELTVAKEKQAKFRRTQSEGGVPVTASSSSVPTIPAFACSSFSSSLSNSRASPNPYSKPRPPPLGLKNNHENHQSLTKVTGKERSKTQEEDLLPIVLLHLGKEEGNNGPEDAPSPSTSTFVNDNSGHCHQVRKAKPDQTTNEEVVEGAVELDDGEQTAALLAKERAGIVVESPHEKRSHKGKNREGEHLKDPHKKHRRQASYSRLHPQRSHHSQTHSNEGSDKEGESKDVSERSARRRSRTDSNSPASHRRSHSSSKRHSRTLSVGVPPTLAETPTKPTTLNSQLANTPATQEQPLNLKRSGRRKDNEKEETAKGSSSSGEDKQNLQRRLRSSSTSTTTRRRARTSSNNDSSSGSSLPSGASGAKHRKGSSKKKEKDKEKTASADIAVWGDKWRLAKVEEVDGEGKEVTMNKDDVAEWLELSQRVKRLQQSRGNSFRKKKEEKKEHNKDNNSGQKTAKEGKEHNKKEAEGWNDLDDDFFDGWDALAPSSSTSSTVSPSTTHKLAELTKTSPNALEDKEDEGWVLSDEDTYKLYATGDAQRTFTEGSILAKAVERKRRVLDPERRRAGVFSALTGVNDDEEKEPKKQLKEADVAEKVRQAVEAWGGGSAVANSEDGDRSPSDASNTHSTRPAFVITDSFGGKKEKEKEKDKREPGIVRKGSYNISLLKGFRKWMKEPGDDLGGATNQQPQHGLSFLLRGSISARGDYYHHSPSSSPDGDEGTIPYSPFARHKDSRASSLKSSKEEKNKPPQWMQWWRERLSEIEKATTQEKDEGASEEQLLQVKDGRDQTHTFQGWFPAKEKLLLRESSMLPPLPITVQQAEERSNNHSTNVDRIRQWLGKGESVLAVIHKKSLIMASSRHRLAIPQHSVSAGSSGEDWQTYLSMEENEAEEEDMLWKKLREVERKWRERPPLLTGTNNNSSAEHKETDGDVTPGNKEDKKEKENDKGTKEEGAGQGDKAAGGGKHVRISALSLGSSAKRREGGDLTASGRRPPEGEWSVYLVQFLHSRAQHWLDRDIINTGSTASHNTSTTSNTDETQQQRRKRATSRTWAVTPHQHPHEQMAEPQHREYPSSHGAEERGSRGYVPFHLPCYETRGWHPALQRWHVGLTLAHCPKGEDKLLTARLLKDNLLFIFEQMFYFDEAGFLYLMGGRERVGYLAHLLLPPASSSSALL